MQSLALMFVYLLSIFVLCLNFSWLDNFKLHFSLNFLENTLDLDCESCIWIVWVYKSIGQVRYRRWAFNNLCESSQPKMLEGRLIGTASLNYSQALLRMKDTDRSFAKKNAYSSLYNLLLLQLQHIQHSCWAYCYSYPFWGLSHRTFVSLMHC